MGLLCHYNDYGLEKCESLIDDNDQAPQSLSRCYRSSNLNRNDPDFAGSLSGQSSISANGNVTLLRDLLFQKYCRQFGAHLGERRGPHGDGQSVNGSLFDFSSG